MEKREKSEEPLNRDSIAVIQDENKNLTIELKHAKKKLVYQNNEKEKRAAELIISNKEQVFQNEEKEKCVDELVVTHNQLKFQIEEKENRTEELLLAYTELQKAQESQKEYIIGLEKMIFITSHKVRQPITQIQGVSVMLDGKINTQEELREIIGYMKESINSLDTFTRELTTYIYELQNKVNINNEADD